MATVRDLLLKMAARYMENEKGEKHSSKKEEKKEMKGSCGCGRCAKCKMMAGKSKMAYVTGSGQSMFQRMFTGANAARQAENAASAPVAPSKPVSNTLRPGVPGYSAKAALEDTKENYAAGGYAAPSTSSFLGNITGVGRVDNALNKQVQEGGAYKQIARSPRP
jgi:hypothetical protein